MSIGTTVIELREFKEEEKKKKKNMDKIGKLIFLTSKFKILRIERGDIGIGVKAQETSLDTGMCLTVCTCAITAHFTNSGCILESRDTPTSQVII